MAKQKPAYFNCPYDDADIVALKALEAGKASEDQQKRALKWIVHSAAMTYDQWFEPNDPNGRIGAFIDGRQFVGHQIRKLLLLPTSLATRNTGDR
jgi:hypothetical protein